MLNNEIFVNTQELGRLRQENFKKWKQDDFDFYENFFNDIPISEEINIIEEEYCNEQNPSKKFKEEAWQEFHEYFAKIQTI
jgi:hypothetical protein